MAASSLCLPFPSGSRGSFALITKLLFTPTDGDRHTSDASHRFVFLASWNCLHNHYSLQPLACEGFCPPSWSPPDDWQVQSSISAYAKLKQCLLKKKHADSGKNFVQGKKAQSQWEWSFIFFSELRGTVMEETRAQCSWLVWLSREQKEQNE